MKIHPCTSPHKIMMVYLSAEEAADQTLKASLEAKCAVWKADGYLPAFLISGSEPLEEGLYSLMKRNLRKMAEERAETKENASCIPRTVGEAS